MQGTIAQTAFAYLAEMAFAPYCVEPRMEHMTCLNNQHIADDLAAIHEVLSDAHYIQLPGWLLHLQAQSYLGQPFCIASSKGHKACSNSKAILFRAVCTSSI